MLQPPLESTGITSCRKLAAVGSAGSWTFTVTFEVLPEACTVSVAEPFAMGCTQPAGVTRATFSLLLRKVAEPVKSTS